MAAATSFYFAIFKKLQVIAGLSFGGYPHYHPAGEEDSLGFNVITSDENGFFAPLSHDAITGIGGFPQLTAIVEQADPNNPGAFLEAYPILPPSDPLTNVPEANPLYAMLRASIA
jgi:hypothetical protein